MNSLEKSQDDINDNFSLYSEEKGPRITFLQSKAIKADSPTLRNRQTRNDSLFDSKFENMGGDSLKDSYYDSRQQSKSVNIGEISQIIPENIKRRRTARNEANPSDQSDFLGDDDENFVSRKTREMNPTYEYNFSRILSIKEADNEDEARKEAEEDNYLLGESYGVEELPNQENTSSYESSFKNANSERLSSIKELDQKKKNLPKNLKKIYQAKKKPAQFSKKNFSTLI